MRFALLARASLAAVAITLPSCYWLAQYADLSSAYGDAGSNPDGSSVVDAGLVAQTFCPPDAGALVYCMEFDGVDASALGLEASAANVAVVGDASVSPPSSLYVGLQGGTSFGQYAVSFPDLQPLTTTLEFQIQTVNLNEGVTTLAIALLQASTLTVQKLNVVVLPNSQFQVQEYFGFADGGSNTTPHSTFQLNPGAGGGASPGWHHVILSLTVNPKTEQYTSGFKVDSQVFEDGGQPLLQPWMAGSVSLYIGVTYALARGPEFFFDNVRADFDTRQ